MISIGVQDVSCGYAGKSKSFQDILSNLGKLDGLVWKYDNPVDFGVPYFSDKTLLCISRIACWT